MLKDHANYRDDDNYDDDVSMMIPMHDVSMLMMMMMMMMMMTTMTMTMMMKKSRP